MQLEETRPFSESEYILQFKFNLILLDSLSLIKILENEQFDSYCFLFIVDFESLYTNIPVKYAIKLMKELASKYKKILS